VLLMLERAAATMRGRGALWALAIGLVILSLFEIGAA
jgi:hypothetical protein